MRGASLLRIISVLAVFLAFPPVAVTQTGFLVVKVTDYKGVLPGAIVTVWHDNGFVEARMTDGRGLTMFPALPAVAPGREGYNVVVEQFEHKIEHHSNVRIVFGRTGRVDFHLRWEWSSRCFPIFDEAPDCEGTLASVTRVGADGSLFVEFDSDKLDSDYDRVRLIGVGAVKPGHPRRPVEYLHEEAYVFTKRVAEWSTVCLKGEPSIGDRDSSGRLQRYVYLRDGKLLNAVIIAQGYGFVDTRFPPHLTEEFRQYEDAARECGLGLWAPRGKAGD